MPKWWRKAAQYVNTSHGKLPINLQTFTVISVQFSKSLGRNSTPRQTLKRLKITTRNRISFWRLENCTRSNDARIYQQMPVNSDLLYPVAFIKKRGIYEHFQSQISTISKVFMAIFRSPFHEPTSVSCQHFDQSVFSPMIFPQHNRTTNAAADIAPARRSRLSPARKIFDSIPSPKLEVLKSIAHRHLLCTEKWYQIIQLNCSGHGSSSYSVLVIYCFVTYIPTPVNFTCQNNPIN